MPSSPQIPSPDNDYAAPAGMSLGRAQWDAVFASVGARLRELEAKGATWDELIAAGTSQALASIAANVAPHLQEVNTQVAALQESVAEAQDIIADINAGIIPATAIAETAARIWLSPALRDGWSSAIAALETWRAAPTVPTAAPGTNSMTAASTAFVQAAIAALINAAPGTLDTLGELAAALGDDSNFAATVSGALAQRLRVDAAQGLTDAQKGQARANMSVSQIRNYLINGNLDFWSYALSRVIAAGGSGMIADRFLITNNTNQPVTVARQLPVNMADVPGNPASKLRMQFAAAPTTGTLIVEQRIENVGTLSGQSASARAYVTGPVGSDALSCTMVQNFGTGGSPSSPVTVAAAALNISTIYSAITSERRAQFAPLPSISGKSIGTNGKDYLALRWTLTPRQAGNYDVTRLSLVSGDASYEADPFPFIAPEAERARIERFCERSYPTGYLLGDVTLAGVEQSAVFTQWILQAPTVKFRVPKLFAPSVTVYSPFNGSSANFALYDQGGTFRLNCPAGASLVSTNGFSGGFTSGEATVGYYACYHWLAVSELS